MTAGLRTRTLTFFCVLTVSVTPFYAAAESDEEILFTAEAGPFAAEAGPEIEATANEGQSLPALYDPEDIITLREAAVLALRNNIDIELARIDPVQAGDAIEEARGAFDPVGSADFTFAHDETPNRSILARTPSIGTDAWSSGTGFAGQLPLGLQYSTTLDFDRSDTDSPASTLERAFDATWGAQLTMPLLRDFRTNLASVSVKRTELGKEISDEQFAQTLTQLLGAVEDLYWNLAAADASVRVAKKSLQAAEDLLNQTRIQEEVGVVSRIAVKQAEAGVAERELNLIRLENDAANAKDAFIDAVLAPRSPATFDDREILTQPPSFEAYDIDLEKAIETAVANRPEMAVARKAVDSSELDSDLADNQALPRFDLIASYGTKGLSGSRNPDAGSFGGMLTPEQQATLAAQSGRLIGSSTDAFDNFFRASGEKSFSAGFRVELPFGNRTGKARARQSRTEVRRAKALLRKQRQVVTLDVRRAARTIETAEKAVQASERRRAASEESLRAEQERLRLGDSTPFQVLQFEEDVADAERQVIDTLRLLQNAITAFEVAQGTLLRSRGISIDEAMELENR